MISAVTAPGRAGAPCATGGSTISTGGSTITSPRVLAAGLLLAIGFCAAVGATAPAAHADATDDAFLAALRAKGINYPNPMAALIAGHEVCNELDLGKTPPQIASDVMNNTQLDGYHAGYFVGASIRAYCPKYAP